MTQKNKRVSLLKLNSQPNEMFPADATSAILKLSTFDDVEFWVGHDLITGDVAVKVKTDCAEASSES